MGLRDFPFTRRVLHFDPLTGRKRVTTLGNASLGIGRGGRQFERLLKILLFLAYFPPKLSVVLFRFPVEVRRGVPLPHGKIVPKQCLVTDSLPHIGWYRSFHATLVVKLGL